MTKNLFPLTHNYDLLKDNGNKLIKETNKIIQRTPKPPKNNPSDFSVLNSRILGRTLNVKLNNLAGFTHILFDGDVYFIEEFVVSVINQDPNKVPNVPQSESEPDLISGKIYCEDDSNALSVVRTFCYLNKDCLSRPENSAVLKHLSDIQPAMQNIPPMNGIWCPTEFDFPITALQLFQRALGIDSKV